MTTITATIERPRGEFAVDPAELAAIALLARDTNIEDMAVERGDRVLRIVGNESKPALIPLVPRSARTIDLAVGERRNGPIQLRHDGQRRSGAPPVAGCARSANEHGSDCCIRTC